MRRILVTVAIAAVLSTSAGVRAQSSPPADVRARAEQGDAATQKRLADYYFRVDDDANGLIWLRKAAENGDVDAQNLLGFRYKTGGGVPQDREQSRRWYRKAADQGSAPALQNLCMSYTDPLELTKGIDPAGAFPLPPLTARKQDLAEAFGWCSKAANAGMPEATVRLGLIYARGGPGIAPDYEQAYFWLLVRSATSPLREAIGRAQPPDKRAEVETRAPQWKPPSAARPRPAT
jgi:TPR repeat protein